MIQILKKQLEMIRSQSTANNPIGSDDEESAGEEEKEKSSVKEEKSSIKEESNNSKSEL